MLNHKHPQKKGFRAFAERDKQRQIDLESGDAATGGLPSSPPAAVTAAPAQAEQKPAERKGDK